MVMKLRLYKGQMSKKQMKLFFEFILDVYSGKIKKDVMSMSGIRTLDMFGFCAMFRDFFGIDTDDYNIEIIPELMKHKPKKKFYTHEHLPTEDDTQFWFPIGKDQSKRIEIAETILKQLK